MKLLLTNDDGLEAPGLAALADALRDLGELVVVAPDIELSGCSHRVTTDRPLRLQEVAPNRYRLDGTPADCVRVAMRHLGLEVDYVISGINPGGNLGADIYMSGTVAAAREAALWSVPGIAVSQYRRSRDPVDWLRATRWTTHVVGQILSRPRPDQGFWNVNFPDPPHDPPAASAGFPPIVECRPDPHPLDAQYRADGELLLYRGRYQNRGRAENCDVAHCFSGAITISELTLD